MATDDTAPDPYPWTRRTDESAVAYEAFRTYLNQGTDRSTAHVAHALGKTKTIMDRWSSQHDWVERVRAYDVHMETAATDGYADELISVRKGQLQLLDRMTGHVSTLLDHYIAKGAEPSVRFTQFASMVFKAQESAVRMRMDGKNDGVMEKILKAVERLETGE